MIELHKGDYLTFASIAAAVGVEVKGPDFRSCEIESGVWRRHPQIGERSRSDISRDGYMGVLLFCAVKDKPNIVSRIRKAGWKRRWTMGDRGTWDHINIAPLVPILYAFKWKWFPTIPTLCTPLNNTGFRAHLLALAILIEHCMGKRRWSHRKGAKGLAKKNPRNLWFRALVLLTHGDAPTHHSDSMFGEEHYHWGGCPLELFIKLTNFTAGLPR
jgi:hypothetical protein